MKKNISTYIPFIYYILIYLILISFRFFILGKFNDPAKRRIKRRKQIIHYYSYTRLYNSNTQYYQQTTLCGVYRCFILCLLMYVQRIKHSPLWNINCNVSPVSTSSKFQWFGRIWADLLWGWQTKLNHSVWLGCRSCLPDIDIDRGGLVWLG